MHFTVTYRFALPDQSILTHSVTIDETTMLSDYEASDPPPHWTALDYRQCEGCELKDAVHCPVALRLVKPLSTFKTLLSYAVAEVTVITAERDYHRKIEIQEALRSLLGLIMATSGCPSMAPFRPMARYHLPFSSLEETIYRITSTYLMRQFMRHPGQTQIPVDMGELGRLYDVIKPVNAGLSQRIRVAVEADGALNALVIFDSFSQLIPEMIAEELDRLKPAFD